jgi:hypothetical protein
MNGLPAARAQVVDRLRDQLLAGARLALDEHGARDRRHLLDLDQDFLDRGALSADAGMLLQPVAVDEPAHRLHDFIGLERLLHRERGTDRRDPVALCVVGRLEEREGEDFLVLGEGAPARARAARAPRR